MDFVRRYRAYLRDNPHGYWFKNKVYGWGWVPVRWQGWVVLLAYIAIFVPMFLLFLAIRTPTNDDVTRFLLEVFALAAALILVCYITGEDPKWQWGIPKKK